MSDWHAYDEPPLLDAVSVPGAHGRTAQLVLDGMHCGSCVSRVEGLLAGIAQDVRVNLASRTVDFVFGGATRLSEIASRLEQAGFVPQPLAQDAAARSRRLRRRHALARVGVALICSMQVMMLAWPTYFGSSGLDAGSAALLRWAQWILATPALLYSGWPYLHGAWRGLRSRTPGMEVPVALSLLVAYAVSAARTVTGSGELYFDAVTMFVLLLGAGRYLEDRTRARADERLHRLLAARPLAATRIEEGHARSVPISGLAAGDVVSVAPGEALPVDGTLLDEAHLDESLLTGESHPVHHSAGSAACGGSLNAGSAPVRVQATAAGTATRIALIEQTLRAAALSRPRFQHLADRLAAHFVLGVLVLAAAGAIAWWPHDPERALHVLLSVLVASCPCALSLAVPAVRAAASARLASAGVLLARPAALERACGIDTVLLDKTGTLTRPGFLLLRLHTLGGVPAQRCMEIAAALESGLGHPVARAFADPAVAPAQDRRLLPEGGVEGVVDAQRYRLCAAARRGEGRIDALLSDPANGAFTWIELRRDDIALALFGLGAQIRPEAPAVMARLARDGLQLELLSGDGPEAVASVAQALGIRHGRSRQAPQDKLARLDELRRSGRVVMAVGDGVNDAPFLAAADVAVALPEGAALAQARADVILTGDSLAGMTMLLDVARRARRRIRQNVAWSVAYNLSIMPLALAGLLSPWMAALGMSMSSLLVVVNALRLDPPRET